MFQRASVVCIMLVATVAVGQENSSSTGTYGGISTLILLDKKLHQELKLDDKQVKQIREVQTQYSKKLLKLGRIGFGFGQALQERIAKMKKRENDIRGIALQFEPQLGKLFNSQQRRRFAEIVLQHHMTSRPLKVLGYDEQLAAQLKLKKEQIDQIRKIDEARRLDPRRPKILASVKQGMKVLSESQRKTLQNLQGNKYPVRMLGFSPFKKSFRSGFFKSLDKNKDGKLTKAEARFFWRVNQKYDKNKDDVLDKKEIQAAIDDALRRQKEYIKQFDAAIGRS